MKVVHLSTYPTGGAAKAAFRLHCALLENNVDSYFLSTSTGMLQNKADSVVAYDSIDGKGALGYVKQKVKERMFFSKTNAIQSIHSKDHELFTLTSSPYELKDHPLVQDADIINLHWVANFVNISSFFTIKNKNLVWTMHDMNPFTGGCHYSDGCDLYKKTCASCPQLVDVNKKKFASRQHSQKLAALDQLSKNGSNLKIVGPSKWLMESSMSSSVFKDLEHRNIHYSLDLDVFRQYDKSAVKKMLGFSNNKKVLLFVAENLSIKRKGFGMLVEALKNLNHHEVQLVSIGSKAPKLSGFDHKHMGMLTDEQLMALAYAAADAFIIPSREDNLPNTMLESLSCGTPVIGFDIGGVGNIVKHKHNGVLCSEVSSVSLEKGIALFLEGSIQFNNEMIAKESASMFANSRQASEYLDLYRSFQS